MKKSTSKRMKSLLSLFLVAVMLLGNLGITALADEPGDENLFSNASFETLDGNSLPEGWVLGSSNRVVVDTPSRPRTSVVVTTLFTISGYTETGLTAM